MGVGGGGGGGGGNLPTDFFFSGKERKFARSNSWKGEEKHGGWLVGWVGKWRNDKLATEWEVEQNKKCLLQSSKEVP